MLPRFLAIAAVVMLLALAAPAIAPQMLATFQPQAAVAVEEAPAARPADARRATIAADAGGHYATDAIINGRTVAAVIDTGATTVVLSQATARRLGFHLVAADYTASIRTANGIIRAAPVSLGSISLGNVAVHDVAAVVVEGESLELNLIGMSFLNRLARFEAGDGQLVLVQ
jgi:aspartyl protease family protein